MSNEQKDVLQYAACLIIFIVLYKMFSPDGARQWILIAVGSAAGGWLTGELAAFRRIK